LIVVLAVIHQDDLDKKSTSGDGPRAMARRHGSGIEPPCRAFRADGAIEES